jgi:hypothetical protein
MALSRLGGIDILRRDPLHRVPGCWYLKDSRMLHDLDDPTPVRTHGPSQSPGRGSGRPRPLARWAGRGTTSIGVVANRLAKSEDVADAIADQAVPVEPSLDWLVSLDGCSG